MDVKVLTLLQESQGLIQPQPVLQESRRLYQDVVVDKEILACFQCQREELLGAPMVRVSLIGQGIDGGGIEKDHLKV